MKIYKTTNKIKLLQTYFYFLNLHKPLRKQTHFWFNGFENNYLFISFVITIYSIFKFVTAANPSASPTISTSCSIFSINKQIDLPQIGMTKPKQTTVLIDVKYPRSHSGVPVRVQAKFKRNTNTPLFKVQNQKPNPAFLMLSPITKIGLPEHTKPQFDRNIHFIQNHKLQSPKLNLLTLEAIHQTFSLPNTFSLSTVHLLPHSSNPSAGIPFQLSSRICLRYSSLPNEHPQKIHQFGIEQEQIPYSFSRFLKRKNIKFSFSKDKPAIHFDIPTFADVYEPITGQSYEIFLQLGWLVFFSLIFQNLYKDFGKEILSIFIEFLKLIGVIEDEQWFKEELNLTTEKRQFRSIRKSTKNLRDIIGIESIIIEISEMIWFLRAKKQPLSQTVTNLVKMWKFQNPYSFNPIFQTSTSFLLVGPPGNGKTFLVQAIAGESSVPILIQSGSILKNPQQQGKGAQNLQLLFQRARRITPCIVFIDEVDGLGARRENMTIHCNEYDLLEILEMQFMNQQQTFKQEESLKSENENVDLDSLYSSETRQIPISVLQQNELHNISRSEQLTMLTQLLIELDGLKTRNDLMIIGATNRLKTLDPALLRPGRFHNQIKIQPPDYQKRVSLLKTTSQTLGTEQTIPWTYLAKQTQELSAAALCSMVNESALIAIMFNQKHTLSSLQHGLARIQQVIYRQISPRLYMENKQITQFYEDYMQLQRLPNPIYLPFESQKQIQGYMNKLIYSIGQNVFSTLFRYTPYIGELQLSTEKSNFYLSKRNSHLDKFEEQIYSRSQLETKLIFLFSGKTTQLLSTSLSLITNKKHKDPKINFHLNESDNYGKTDFSQAHTIIHYMIAKWYMYAEQIITEKYHQIQPNFNSNEFDMNELRLLEAVAEELNFEIHKQNQIQTLSQKWGMRAWWQKYLQQQFHFTEHGILEWYRLYLSDPEETEQNIEWVPPDSFFTSTPEQLSPLCTWNTWLLYTQHYLYKSLIINAINRGLHTSRHSTELIDLLIDRTCRHFKIEDPQIDTQITHFYQFQNQLNLSEYPKEAPLIVRHKWGKNSRIKNSKKIFMEKIQQFKEE